MNNKQVAHNWAFQNKSHGMGSNFFFEEEILYSYRRSYPLAKLFNGLALVKFTPYSNSTARHKSYAQRSLREAGTPDVEVENVVPESEAHHLENLDLLYEEAISARDDYHKRREGSAVKDYAKHRYNEIVKWAHKYAEHFDITDKKYQLELIP